MNKKDADYYLNNIGLAYYEMENYNEALNYLNQALKKNPHNYHAYVNLALVYKELGNLDKAIAILTSEVLAKQPHMVSAMVNLANIYQFQA